MKEEITQMYKFAGLILAISATGISTPTYATPRLELLVNQAVNELSTKPNLPKCIVALNNLVTVSDLSPEHQHIVLGPYRSTEVRLEDGKYYSISVDTSQKLKVLVRSENGRLDASGPIELDAASAKELSSRQVTPISVAGRFMLLAQGSDGQGSIIEILPQAKGMRRSQIQRVAVLQNRPDINGKTRGVWTRTGINQNSMHALQYFYETTERDPKTGVTKTLLLNKVLTMNSDKYSHVNASSDKILFGTDQNASGLHLLTPIEGRYHVGFVRPAQDVLLNGEQLRVGSVEVHEMNIKSEGTAVERTGVHKLENEIKFRIKPTDGAIKSVLFLKSRSTQQPHVVVILENAAYAGRLFGDAIMSKVDVNLQRYIDSFEILSQENFDGIKRTGAFNPETVGTSAIHIPGSKDGQVIIGDGVDARAARIYEGIEGLNLNKLIQSNSIPTSNFILNKKIPGLNNLTNFKVVPKDTAATYYKKMADAVEVKLSIGEKMLIRTAPTQALKHSIARELIIEKSSLTNLTKTPEDLDGVANALVTSQELIHGARIMRHGYRNAGDD